MKRRAPTALPGPTVAQVSAHLSQLGDLLADSSPACPQLPFDMLADAQAMAPGSPVVELLQAMMLPTAADYQPHIGDACPVAAGALVAVTLGHRGPPLVDLAGSFYWGPGLADDGAGRILYWARVDSVSH